MISLVSVAEGASFLSRGTDSLLASDIDSRESMRSRASVPNLLINILNKISLIYLLHTIYFAFFLNIENPCDPDALSNLI